MYSKPLLAVGGELSGERRKVTVPELRARKQQNVIGGSIGLANPSLEGASNAPSCSAKLANKKAAKIAMVTAYDFTMARLVDEAGVDVILVGDSLGMVIQGLANTIPVTLDEIAYHGRAVARGVQRAHVVGDMPFMSYQVSATQAVENAGKLMKEGAFESVKLEGGQEIAEHVRRIVRAGIPVMGHVGLTPQSVHALGGFKMQGRGREAADRILDDARAIEEAGAFAIVLEAIPPDVAARVTASLSIPTIGIGAGIDCDGQVLVCTDLLGMSRGHRPKFAKRYAPVGDNIVEAMRAFVREVRSDEFPLDEHAYKANSSAEPSPRSSGEGPRSEESIPLDLWH